MVDHINVPPRAYKDATAILTDGLIAIITPKKPIVIAVHRLQPIVSPRKIMARIHEKIGTACDMTVTSATGNF